MTNREARDSARKFHQVRKAMEWWRSYCPQPLSTMEKSYDWFLRREFNRAEESLYYALSERAGPISVGNYRFAIDTEKEAIETRKRSRRRGKGRRRAA